MRNWRVVAAAACALVIAACGDDDSDSGRTGPTTEAPSAASTTTTAPAPTEPLRVLVTNDDGIGAPGIDALVEALLALPDTEVTVVAPATNQSGTGGRTTAGTLTVTDATTASGFAGRAVAGFPADTIVWALDQGGVDERPHLVISGVNAGQNIGVAVDVSGTVGAARAAAVRGIPALAVSQGLGEPPDYPSGVAAALDWLAEHRAELLARDPAAPGPAFVDNLNVPTCTTGEVRGVVEVPVAGPDLAPLAPVDCTAPLADPDGTTDVEAFQHGYVTITEDLALEPAA
jgi:5'-nucleotidase